MQSNEPLEKKFEDAFNTAAATAPIFTYNSRLQMGQMVEAIARGSENIAKRLSTEQSAAVRGGFIAEELHAETFNLDAILKGKSARAVTDQYKPEWDALGRISNDTADIVITENGQQITAAQSKYNNASAKTTAELSKLNADGTPKYGEMDSLLAPADQVDAIKAKATTIAEKLQTKDADKSTAYKQTANKVGSKLEHDGVSSTEVSKADADRIGSGDMSKHKKTESNYQTRSTLQQVGKAAVGAAAMSAVVSGSINTVRYITLAREGKISAEDATIKILAETAASAADSAVKAGAVAGAQSLLVRYGTEKIVVETLVKQSMNSMLRTNAVTVGVVCLVDAVKDLVSLGTGRISKDMFYERQGKGILNTSAGVMGGALGAAAMAPAIAGLGASGALATTLSLVGGLSGGLIAGLAMTFAIENHIEKPYQELVQNTQYTQDAARELERVSQNIFVGQVAFSKFLQESTELDKKIQTQMNKLDQSGRDAFDAIMKI